MPEPDRTRGAGDEHGGTAAPLAGYRVVEMTMYIQGPTAGLVLAGLGADVIKIEQVDRPDLMRDMASFYGVDLDERARTWLYAALNRGKRSFAFDVASEQGAAVFRQLIAGADAFVTNLREDALRRFGADPDTLRAVNPRLVYGRGGGFGLRGPLACDPCQDTVGMAYAGFMDTTSASDEPYYPPGALSDVLTGTNLAAAVLAGLLARRDGGDGALVATTQLQSLIWLQMLNIGVEGVTGQRVPRFSRADLPNPLFNVFPTADGWISVAVIHQHQWGPVIRTLELGHLEDDPRFSSFGRRKANREELTRLVEEKLAERTTRDWWQRFRAAGVWAAPVNRAGDLLQDEQARANEYLVEHPDGFLSAGLPFEVADWRWRPSTAAQYGEHSDEVLAELGFTEEEIVSLRLAGCVW